MAPTKMKLRMRKKEGGAKASRRLLTETSPDSKCPICLDRFNNVASLDRCLHRFCFRCIHEWSKNKAECPLCKQPFRSIFHSVKAENDFKEFVLAPMENGPVAAALPRADQTDSGVPLGRSRRARAPRGAERRSRRHQNSAPAATSLDVRLEGLVEEAADQNRGVQHMMLRLTQRRRSRVEEHGLRRLRDQDVVAFRRALYRTGVRVRSGGWDTGRQRDISAAHLRRNPACLRRLLPWLQRELTVLYGSHGSLVNIVQHIIMSRITHYDMDDAAIRDELHPFLLARTDHFLHELVSFARSTLSIEAYDQQAVYECPAPSYEEDSSSDSSIIAISEDEVEEADITEDSMQEQIPPVPMATGGESSLSQSAWDDETPGPSYSTLLPSPSQSQTEGAEPTSASVQADEAGDGSGAVERHEDEEEECMIVGYVKPMAERTPELVQLSSDSSEEEQEAAATETAAAAKVPKAETSSSQAQAPSFPESYLPPLSPSSIPCPSASRSPPLNIDRVSPPYETLCRSHSPDRDGVRQSRPARKEHNQQLAFSYHSRSSSESSVLSRHSGCSRSNRRSGSGSRHPNHQEAQKWSHQSSGRSPIVSIASDSSDSPRSNIQRKDEERDLDHSVPSRERSPQSSVCRNSPSHNTGQRKTTKKRKKEKERSRSPVRVYSTSHGRSRDSRHRRGCHKHRHHTGSHSSSSRSTSSSSSSDSLPDNPCPEKPSGKRKYKTRHLERAAQRQSSQKFSKDKDCQAANNSPIKKHHGGMRERSRSPSVEIIFERRAPDTPSQTHWWRRKRHKKRSRREARERNSPTVITIDSDSDRTNDYQDCITTDTVDYQERVPKVSNTTNDDQHHAAQVKSINTDSQGRGIKATNSTTDDQLHAVKVTSSTIDNQHSATKISSSTSEDHQRDIKMSKSATVDQQHAANSTSDDQQHAAKLTKNLTGWKPATEACKTAADQQHHVSEATGNSQSHVLDGCHSSMMDVSNPAIISQASAADAVDQPVKVNDPMTATAPDMGNRAVSQSSALHSPSLESYSPVTPTEHISESPDCPLNLEDCVVDVVDRESFERSCHNMGPGQPGRSDNCSRDVSMPSDTRLLESILQELEDILPEEVQGTESRLEEALVGNGVDQLEARAVPPSDQADSDRQPGEAEITETNSVSQRGAETRPDFKN